MKKKQAKPPNDDGVLWKETITLPPAGAKARKRQPKEKAKVVKTRVKSPSGLREKGKRYERAAAEKLEAVYPNAKRGIGQMRAANEVPDVDGTPWWVEAKHYTKTPNVHKAFKQALAALNEHREKHPAHFPAGVLILSKQTDAHEIASMPLETFLTMLRHIQKLDVIARLAYLEEICGPLDEELLKWVP